ncbi:hypothetical protein ColTof4_14438 [Colletotrichum tofieldiae]|nr:hypothetical protein ColTof4_14438 [Colletotrichum tofieldiae]
MELCQVLTQCVTVIIGEVVQKLWWLVLQVLRKTLVFLILSGLVYLFLYTVARRPLSWATAVVFGSYTPGSAPRIATHVAQVQRDPPAPKHELTAAPAAPANPYVPGAQVGLEYLSAVVTRPQKDGPASEILLSVFEEEGSRPKNGDANAVATAWSSRWDDLQHAMADAALSDREAHGAVMERLAHAFHGATAILVEMRNRPASAMAAADASARRGFVARASRLARTVADQAVGAVTRARRPRRRSATLELVYRRAASFADLLGSAILDCELMMSFATSNSELHRRISFVEEGVCGMVGVFNRAVLVGDKAVDQATNAHRKQGRRRQQAVMQRGEAKAEASLTTRELSQAVFTLRGWQAFGSQVCEQARESSAMLEGWFLDAEAERRRLDTRRGVVQGQLAMLDMEVCSDDDAVRIEEELETQIGEFVGALRSMYTNES